MSFDYSIDFTAVDFRRHPELYRIGRGEQGVLLIQPYKQELLPHWRFKTPEVAQKSADAIYALYLSYRAADDFVGMDMARKFLQMGWTRSRRYANHRTGKKYVGSVKAEHRGRSGAWGRELAPLDQDDEKQQSARIFKQKLDVVRADPEYVRAAQEHKSKYEASSPTGAIPRRTRKPS